MYIYDDDYITQIITCLLNARLLSVFSRWASTVSITYQYTYQLLYLQVCINEQADMNIWKCGMLLSCARSIAVDYEISNVSVPATPSCVVIVSLCMQVRAPRDQVERLRMRVLRSR